MYIRFYSMICGMAFFGALLLPSLQADEWNKKTVITITEPVQMPNCCTPDHTVTLQPGTYVLALVESLSDRHIVRVFEKDEKTVVTTILAIPNYRLKPTGNMLLAAMLGGLLLSLLLWVAPRRWRRGRRDMGSPGSTEII